MIGEVYCLP